MKNAGISAVFSFHVKIKTLGSISAGKDIIFSIRVPENNCSEMNKLPVLSLHVGTWRDRRTECVDTPAEGISEATDHNWYGMGTKNVIFKNSLLWGTFTTWLYLTTLFRSVLRKSCYAEQL